ncbi:MAG: toll/interleukin-1 receptor domain-containing protein [Planctomycetes bacterium]|nr:toll/interleukin-1 receptor domain-containing protein [Planctomycetota bacterium]
MRTDHETVDRLCSDLRRSGVTTWVDRDSLLPGQKWRQEIRKAIREGAAFIACFSPDFLDREKSYMHEELTLAIEELRQRPSTTSWFIPILLSQCEVPDTEIRAGETLRDIHFVELYRDWNEGIRSILKTISMLSGGMDHETIELRSQLIASLERLVRDAEVLWRQDVSEGTLLAYRDSLTDAVRQLTRSSRVLELDELDDLQDLLHDGFNFRVGKEQLLQMRQRRRNTLPRYHRLFVEDLRRQIQSNGSSFEQLQKHLSSIKDRHRATENDG